MCKSEGVKLFTKETTYNANSVDELENRLREMQSRKKVMLGKKVLAVEITNGVKVLEMFVGANRVGGWERNGGTHETPDYVRGVDGVVDFFKLSLAS